MQHNEDSSGSPAWSNLEGYDKLLGHRVRLGITVLLTQHDELSFSRLKLLLRESDGSLGAHLRKLEDSGYLQIRKEFQDRKPVTWYRLTRKGRHALETHLQALRGLIDQTTA